MITYTQIIQQAKHDNPEPPHRVEKTDEEWKELLTPEQYRITRKQGTEMPMSSNLCYVHEPGIYACICCGTELFDSQSKFESGTGWPSFTEPLKDNVVAYYLDETHGMYRIEVRCNVCDAHLGHVFNDGPQDKTGVRFCINGEALERRG